MNARSLPFSNGASSMYILYPEWNMSNMTKFVYLEVGAESDVTTVMLWLRWLHKRVVLQYT